MTRSITFAKLKTFFLLFSVCIGCIVDGLLLSLQPAFYSSEAEKKGATASQYGFVLGIFSIGSFISSPVFANYGDRIGAKLMYFCGALTQLSTGIAFGFLDFVEEAELFITLSYLLRFAEGIGTSARYIAIVGIMMSMFPSDKSRNIGMMETVCGLGYMIGPVVGSFLYYVGGFGMPFFTVGGIGLLMTACQVPLLLTVGNDSQEVKAAETNKVLNVSAVLKSPPMVMPYIENFVCFCGYGMIDSMLGPHLISTIQATQVQVGLVFFSLGGSYMLTSTVVGYISDRIDSPFCLSFAGHLLVTCCFVLLGPASFLPIPPSLPLAFTAVGLFGSGSAFVTVPVIGRVLRMAVVDGCNDDMNTYFVLSGLWTASLHLGNIAGPIAAGYMVENLGFRTAAELFTVLYLAMLSLMWFAPPDPRMLKPLEPRH